MEWDSQKDVIERSKMHLVRLKKMKNIREVSEPILSLQFQTTLCNTALDNPNKLMKQDIVNYMLNYLPTDTILYHSPVSK